MRFNLVPQSPMSSSPLAAAIRCAAKNLEKAGCIVIEKNLFGEHVRYVLTEKGRQTFDQEEAA